MVASFLACASEAAAVAATKVRRVIEIMITRDTCRGAMRLAVLLLVLRCSAQTPEAIQKALDLPVIDAKQPMNEVQVYTASRIPVVPTFASALEWSRYAARVRQE